MSERITGQEAAEALASFCNDYGADIPGFVVALHRQHRTLQQGVGRIMVTMIRQWAANYERGDYDDRNKAICELSRDIIKKVQPEMLHLPLI